QSGVSDVSQCRTINGRLRQRLQQCLPILQMLLSHLPQLLDRRLDDSFDLLTLLVTGLDAAQEPIRRELDTRTHHLRIVGGMSKRATRAMRGVEPPAGAWLRVRIHTDTTSQQAPQEASRHYTRKEATACSGPWELLHT